MNPADVVVAIIKKNNSFLIVQRDKNKHLGLKWEFPGGKVEVNETFEEALSREIREELNISIILQKKIGQEKYKDNTVDVVLHYYLCKHQSGTLALNEHENFAWVKKKDFNNYDFVEGDGNVLSLL